MAQDGNTAGGNSYTIDNVTFPVGRTKLNSIFNAVRTTNMGSSAPDLVAGQFWIDNTTPSATVWTMYFFDGSDSISFATIDTTNNTVNFIDSTFDLINDTTPELGGDLSLNSNNITGTGNINITGTLTATSTITSTSGTSSFSDVNITSELNLTNTGANYIDFAGTAGVLRWLNSSPSFENILVARRDAEIELYYNGSQKLETTSTGIDVTGTVVSDGLTVDTNTLYVDSTNNKVGIGLTNPNDLNSVANNLVIGDGTTQKGLTIYSGTTGSGNLFFADGTTGDAEYRGYLEYIHTSDQFTLGQAGLVRFRINSTESVFNESSYDHDFRVEGNNNTHTLFVDASGDDVFMGANSTNVGIDASTTGFYFRNGGQFRASRTSSQSIIANRISTDGLIIEARKDGTGVGGISSESGDLIIGNDTRGLKFRDSDIIPRNVNLTTADNVVSLGSTTSRFNDAHFGGTVNTNAISIVNPTGAEPISITSSSANVRYAISDGTINADFGIDAGLYGFVRTATAHDFMIMTGNLERMVFKSGGDVIINEDSYDSDFRVESNSNTHALFVDAGLDRVGIGTSSPSYGLSVESATDANASGSFKRTSGSEFRILPQGTICDIGTYSNHTLDFYTNSTRRARLNTSGRFFVNATGDINSERVGILAGTNEQALGLKVSTNAYSLIQGWDASNNIRFTLTGTGELTHYQGGAIFNQNSADSDFRVESNANTHMFFVDGGSNRIGINTSSPTRDITFEPTLDGIMEFRSGGQIMLRPTANNNDHRITALSSSGLDVVWGGATTESLQRWGSNEVIFNENSHDHDFRVESNTSSHALFVDGGSGNVLVGTSDNSPAESTTSNGVRLGNNGGCQFSANGLEVMRINRNTNDGRIIGLCGQTTVRGEIAVSGTVIQYTSYSDHRLKEDIQQISNATESLKQLNPVNFAWIENGVRNNGFLAHEVQSVVPEAVTGTHNEVDDNGNPIYQGLDQSKLVPLLTASLKEAINKIEQLEARISALET